MKKLILEASAFGERYRKMSGFGTYALVLLVLTYPLIPFDTGAINLQKIPLFIWISGVSITWLGVSIALFFEGCVRHSQYGLTRNHPYLNAIVSSLAIILPVYPFVLRTLISLFPDLFSTAFMKHYEAQGYSYESLGIILSFALIGYSKYRSPDFVSEKYIPLYLRPFIVEVVNLFLFCILALQILHLKAS